MNPEKTILIVAPSTSDRLTYRLLLQQDRLVTYHILEATSAIAALAQCQEQWPDLILLAIAGLEMDFTEVRSHLQQQSEAAPIPIVVLAELEQEAIALEAISQGAQDYLLKPEITGALLCRTVRNAITQTHLRYQLEQQTQLLQQTDAQLRVYETEQQTSEATLKAESAPGGKEELFHLIAENIDQFFFVRAAISGQYLYVSPAYEKIWGRTCESLYQDPQSWMEALHPDDRPLVLGSLTDQSQGNSVQREYRIIRPDGAIRWITAYVYPLRNEAGAVVRYVGLAEDMTDRKATEVSLRQYERLVSASSDVMAMVDRTYTYRLVNPACLTWNQTGWDTLVGHQMSEVLGEEVFQTSLKPCLDRCLAGETIRFETWVDYPDGRRFVGVTYAPYTETDGTIAGVALTCRDLTNLKNTEADLQRTQQQLQMILDNSPSTIYLLDVQNRYLLMNFSCAAELRTTPENLIGKSLHEVWPSEIADAFAENNRQVLQSNQPVEIEEVVPQADGLHTYLAIKFPVRDANGIPYGVGGISTDISDRKRAEEALRLSEERFRTAFDNTAVGMVLTTLDGQYLRVNTAFCTFLGYTEAELLERRFQDISHPEDLATDLEFFRRMLAGEIPNYSMEKRFFGKDGHWVWGLLSVSLVRDVYEQPLYLIAQVQDIRDRKRAEEALRLSEEQFRTAFDNTAVGMCLGALDGKYLRANAALCNFLGYTEAELLEMRFQEISHPNDLLTNLELLQRMLAGEIPSYSMEKRFFTKQGYWAWGLLSVSLVRDVYEQPLHLIAQVQDIHDRKQAEADLLQREQEFRTLAENSPDVISRFDRTLRHLYVNPAVERLTGLTVQDFIGKTNREMGLLDPLLVRWESCLNRVFTTGQPEQFEFEFPALEGDREFQARCVPEFASDGSVESVLAISRDTTERKQAERVLRRRAEQERLLGLMSQRVRQSLDLDEILNTTVAEVREFLQTDRVIVYRFEPDWSGLVIAESVVDGWRSLLGLTIPDTCFIEILQGGGVRAITDIHQAGFAESYVEFLVDWQVKSKLVVPILQGEDLWGLVVVHHCREMRSWDSLEVELLQQLAVRVGMAIQQSQMYSMMQLELVDRQRAEAALQELNQELERRVQQRTAQLTEINQQLLTEIVERNQTDQQLRASLKEKEILLKEIHHRVKNNLQIVSSLLNLQADSIQDPATLELFRASQWRVKVMALIHEHLYRSTNLARINFSDYVQSLATDLFQSYLPPGSSVRLWVKVASVELGVDTAIPCGLIINELVSNAIKHAFPNNHSGEIGIFFTINKLSNQYILVVKDNGIGFPKGVLDIYNTESLGLQIVSELTEQLQGNLTLILQEDTTFRIVFPMA